MFMSFIQMLLFSSLLLLSFILLTNPLNVNAKANRWFGASMFLWATFFLDEILVLINAEPLHGISRIVLSLLQFFTPIILFQSILYFTNPNFRFQKKHLSYLIVPLLYFVVLIIDLRSDRNLQTMLIVLTIIHALFYTLMSYLTIRKHQRQIRLYSSNTLEIDLKWLEYIILAVVSIMLIVTVFNLIYIGLPLNTYLTFFMFCTILIITYYSLNQKEIFPLDKKQRAEFITINQEDDKSESSKKKLVSDEELQIQKSKLHAMVLENELYLNPEINLSSLADKMELSSHHLSYIINKGFDQNFFQFINGYRVEKAKTLLMDPKADRLSVLGIAFEAGFSSKSAFNTTFKKITGYTPSAFKNLRND